MKSKNIKMCTQENCSHFSLVASIAVPERATIKLFWSASNCIIGLVSTVLHCKFFMVALATAAPPAPSSVFDNTGSLDLNARGIHPRSRHGVPPGQEHRKANYSYRGHNREMRTTFLCAHFYIFTLHAGSSNKSAYQQSTSL